MKKRDREYEEELNRLEEAYDDDYYDDYDDEEYEDEEFDDDEYYEGEADYDDVNESESLSALEYKNSLHEEPKAVGAESFGDIKEISTPSAEIIVDEYEFEDEPDEDEFDGEYDEEYSDEYDEEYDDESEYYEDEDYDRYYEDDYRDDRNLRRKDSLGARILAFISNTTIVERIAAVFALLLLAGGIATAVFYVSAMNGNRQLDSFAEIGTSLADVDVVGQSGLIAIADSEKAKAMAAKMVEGEEEETTTEGEEEEKVVADDAEGVTIQMTLTSIKSDMKVKFINSETNKLVADLPFEISVVTPDGSTVSYDDHDHDGIIYKKDITAGDYKITPKALPAEYSRYKLDTTTKTLTVKDKVELKTVDVSNEIKKESQVNVAAEDTAVKTAVESQLQDTVEYVESSMTPIGTDGSEFEYKSIEKSAIADPTAGSSLSFGKYFLYAFANDASSSGSIITIDEENGESGSLEISTDDDDDDEEKSSEDDSAELISVDDGDDDDTDDSSDSDSAAEVISTDDDDDDDDSGKGKSKEEKVPLSTTNITIVEGQTTTITSTKKLEIYLYTADTEYVEIDGNKITGIKEGIAVVTVSADDYEDVDIKVTVVTSKATLKTKDGKAVYVKDEDGNYREATYADYNNAKNFFVRQEATSYKYTGWQTLDGKTYYFNKNGDYVTGEQVIQGAKYTFGSDGVLASSSGMMGIDVSKWNGNIDWNAVKKSGVNFAIIRCGYRGSSQGALIEDPMFRTNIRAATAAGIKVGVYFFTQAVNEVEAVEEASMVVKLVSGYNLAFPVYLDVEASNGRGDKISASQRTANIKAFCGTIQNAGFKAGVYANKTWLTSQINASQLTSFKIWLAQYSEAVTYNATRYDMWQYTSKGRVSGISGNVDMNICY
jgi:GH25 family lysozyme M1 (1,4-beta-N-acetylmuramidase)